MTARKTPESNISHIKPSQQKRGTRSYVLRQGRMSPAQKKAIDTWYDDYVLNDAAIAQLPEVFHKPQPLVCSIGFGMGEALIQQAQKHPEKNFLVLRYMRLVLVQY